MTRPPPIARARARAPQCRRVRLPHPSLPGRPPTRRRPPKSAHSDASSPPLAHHFIKPFCLDTVILAGLSGSFAPCPVSTRVGCHDNEDVISLRQRVVNIMQSECRVVAHLKEVFKPSHLRITPV